MARTAFRYFWWTPTRHRRRRLHRGAGRLAGLRPKTIAPVSNGVPFGYIGIGIDEFGNYSNATEGRVGGINTPNLTPDAVAIRGAEQPKHQQTTPTWPAAPRCPSASTCPRPGPRRAHPTTAGCTSTWCPPTAPTASRSASSTGRPWKRPCATSWCPPLLPLAEWALRARRRRHQRARNPQAGRPRQLPLSDDVAGTAYNQPVSINVLNNDIFSYAPTSRAPSIWTSTRRACKARWRWPRARFPVTPEGTVTFTPSGTFAGVVTECRTRPAMCWSKRHRRPTSPSLCGGPTWPIASAARGRLPGARVQYTVTTSNLGAAGHQRGADAAIASRPERRGGGQRRRVRRRLRPRYLCRLANPAAGGTPATNTVRLYRPRRARSG
ncbi:MAG: hypothetical protein WKG07_11880 [Hymenobacter sp.]